MKRMLSEGRGLLVLWGVLAFVAGMVLAVATAPGAPALAADALPAALVDAPAGRALQEWGLPLTIVELGVMVAVIVPIIIGLVEFAKRLGVTGKWSMVLAMGLGVTIGGLVVAGALNVLPGWAGIAVVILLGGLLAGLAATGIYDLQNKKVKADRLVLEEMRRTNALAMRAEQRGVTERFREQEKHVRNLGIPQGESAPAP